MKFSLVALVRRTACLVLAATMGLCTLAGAGYQATVHAAAAGTGQMTLHRPALELSLGEKDQLVPVFSEDVNGTPAVTFKSADSSIVTVDKDGNLEAKKVGKTTVTVACAATGDTIELSVKVIEKEHTFDDHIMISTFWPPNPENMINDEQYKLLADAGVTQVFGAGGGVDHPDYQAKMLELCAKYGMGLTLSGYFGTWLPEWSDEEFRINTGYYKNVPAAYGFFMVDEPQTGNGFVSSYLGLRKYAPNAYCHLNFLPQHYYANEHTYRAVLTDYARLIADGGDKLEYLMFDMYPFGTAGGTMERNSFYANLRSVYEVALKNDVKPAAYIQTVAITGACRLPTDSEIRYEMYTCLAFGYKQLAFFTWFTPGGQGEGFEDGIIGSNGKPNPHYYAIKDINQEIHAIGGTLAKCDALGVYFSSKSDNPKYSYGQPSIPSDLFVQVTNNTSSAKSKAIVSWMRHKETGRNYVMVVNNDYAKAADIDLRFASEIGEIFEVSKKDGSLVPLKMNGQDITVSLAAGDAIFLAMPEGFDFYKAPEGQPSAETNLVEDGIVYASSSEGWNGNFIYNLSDGSRFTAMNADRQVWRSIDKSDSYVKIDLGRTLDFDRVDLYPVGSMFNYGEAFPNNITVSVSDDGETWREVKSFKDTKVTELSAFVLRIGDQTARWIKLDFTDTDNRFGYVALNEVEVYNDKGRLGEPDPIPFLGDPNAVYTYKDGDNIALGKPSFASSATDETFKQQFGWSLDYINDGNPATGWTTAVHRNKVPDVTEFGGVYFGDLYAVEKVVITPKGNTPEDFRIELSEDCENWITIYEVTGADVIKDAITVTLDTPINAKYVQVVGTKLRADNGGNGYLLQLGEIEAYGKPVCDKSVIEAALAIYEAEGGDTAAELYTDAKAALEEPLLTQSAADDYTRRLYVAIGRNPDGSEIPPETEPETTVPVEPDTTVAEPTVTTTPDGDATATPSDGETTAAAGDESETAPEKGCASAVSAGAALALLAGAALTLRRRRDVTEMPSRRSTR